MRKHTWPSAFFHATESGKRAWEEYDRLALNLLEAEMGNPMRTSRHLCSMHLYSCHATLTVVTQLTVLWHLQGRPSMVTSLSHTLSNDTSIDEAEESTASLCPGKVHVCACMSGKVHPLGSIGHKCVELAFLQFILWLLTL